MQRDPAIQALFAAAKEELQHEAFAADVMSAIDRRRRRTIYGWLGIGLALLPCAWLLGTVIQDAVFLLTHLLPSSIVELDNEWLAQFLAPINSISVLVAVGVIGLRSLVRKIFS